MVIEAIVIKKAHAREYDQLVTLYTKEHGKLTVLAKSASKNSSVQALQIDPGNVIRCELVAGRGAPIMTGAQAMRCFSEAKKTPALWAGFQFFLQVIDVLVYEQEEDPALWGCLYTTLATLESSGGNAVSVFRELQLQMLSVLGYGRPDGDAVAWHHGRTDIDDAYERLAQRRLGSIDLFYNLSRFEAGNMI